MNNNRAGPNNQVGRIYFGKLISEQALITMSRVDFFKFINKRACSVIREVRVILNAFIFTILKNYVKKKTDKDFE